MEVSTTPSPCSRNRRRLPALAARQRASTCAAETLQGSVRILRRCIQARRPSNRCRPAESLAGQKLGSRLFHVLHGHLLDNLTLVMTSGLAQGRKALTGPAARRLLPCHRSHRDPAQPPQAKGHRRARMIRSGRQLLPGTGSPPPRIRRFRFTRGLRCVTAAKWPDRWPGDLCRLEACERTQTTRRSRS